LCCAGTAAWRRKSPARIRRNRERDALRRQKWSSENARTANAEEEAVSSKEKRVLFVSGEVINPYPDSPKPVQKKTQPAPWDDIPPVIVHTPPAQTSEAGLSPGIPKENMNQNETQKEKEETDNHTKEKTKTDRRMPVHEAHSILIGEVGSDEQGRKAAHRIAEGEKELRESIEKAMKLRRFEDPKIFKLALELVIRRIGRYGRHINWPNPEVVTMMTLKAEGLPTEPEQLLKLMQEAVEIRGETLNVEEVENDLCVVYGRRVFRPDQPDPHCHTITHERHYELDSEGPIVAPKPAGFFQIIKEVWRSGKKKKVKNKTDIPTVITNCDNRQLTKTGNETSCEGNGDTRPHTMLYRPKTSRPPPVQDWERRIAKLEGQLKSCSNYGYTGPTNWHSPYPPQIKVTQEKATSRIWGGNFVERCLSLGQDMNKTSSKRCNHSHEKIWKAPSLPGVSWTSNTYGSTPYGGSSHTYESIPSRSAVVEKFYQAQKWASTSSLSTDNYSRYSKSSAGKFSDNFSAYSVQSKFTVNFSQYSAQSKFTANFGSVSSKSKSQIPSKNRRDQFGGITRWPSDLSLEIRRRTAALKIFKDVGEEF